MCNELYHHGIKGQRWGVRRFQNPDGSLTDAGTKRYRNKEAKAYQKKLRKLDKELQRTTIYGNQASRRTFALSKKANANMDKANTYAANGNEKKKNKYYKKADKAAKRYYDDADRTKVIQKYQDTLIKDMEDTVKELRSKGYSYKVQQTSYNQPVGFGNINKVLKENGAKSIRFVSPGASAFDYQYANASSGNRITVRDSNQMSDKRKRNWAYKWDAQPYRGQRVDYY